MTSQITTLFTFGHPFFKGKYNSWKWFNFSYIFSQPAHLIPFFRIVLELFRTGFCCCFCLIFQFIRYIISTHRNLLLTSLVIWIYAMVNFFWIVVLIAVLRTSPWTFFWIAVDINCCYSALGMDIFRDCCGHKLLLLGHRHGHFSELLWI